MLRKGRKFFDGFGHGGSDLIILVEVRDQLLVVQLDLKHLLERLLSLLL